MPNHYFCSRGDDFSDVSDTESYYVESPDFLKNLSQGAMLNGLVGHTRWSIGYKNVPPTQHQELT